MNDVVIVGNGPSLLEREMGAIIDEHKTVIRINNYVIEDFERHVGKKTDIWALDTKNLFRHEMFADRLETTPRLWILVSVSYAAPRQPVIDLVDKLHDNYYIAPRSAAVALRSELETFPSTGAFTIYTALSEFADIKPIHIIGFDHWQFEPSSKELNAGGTYWAPFTQPRGHSATIERAYVKGLVKKGLIERL